MLARDRVEHLLESGEIAISYTFTRLGATDPVYLKGEQFVAPAKAELPATQMFRQNFFGDRLLLTLGPIVMTHNPEYRRSRPLYRNRPGYSDIRDTQNTLTIEPREMLSLSTNERIRLRSGTGAYILPRLRNVDAGLLYVPSYIDPHWDGLLQAVIVNLTSHRQQLHLCEGLAICRFYEIAGNVEQSMADAFPAKSHHYGQSWPKILEEEAEPFPRRKHPLPASRSARTKEWAKNFAALYGGIIRFLGYSGGVLALLVVGAILYNRLQQLDSLEKRFEDSDKRLVAIDLQRLPKVEERLGTQLDQLPATGKVSVLIPEGQATALKSFTITKSHSLKSTLWLEPSLHTSRSTIKGKAEPNPANSREVTVAIEAARPTTGPAEEIDVQWMFIP